MIRDYDFSSLMNPRIGTSYVENDLFMIRDYDTDGVAEWPHIATCC